MRTSFELRNEFRYLREEICVNALECLRKVQDEEENSYLFGDDEYTTIDLPVPCSDETEPARVIGVCLSGDNLDCVDVMVEGNYSGYNTNVSLEKLSDDDMLEILGVLECAKK